MNFPWQTIILFAFFLSFFSSAIQTEAGLFDRKKKEECTGCPHCEMDHDEWEAYTASLPVGSRQKCKHGKRWPPFPRSTEPQQTFWQQYHNAHYWPYPYNIQDRAIVQDIISQHAANGWRSATTLFDYHFDPQTHQLNSSGKQQLQWIVNYAPSQHRRAYIAATPDKVISDARIATTQAEVANLLGDDAAVPVLLRVADPIGRPAFEVDLYQRALRDNIITPRIEYVAPTASSGGGS